MQKPLERSSLEAYGGILIGIIVAVVTTMPLWIKGLLLLVAASLCTDAIYRAPLTINLTYWVKRLTALSVWGLAIWAFWFIEPPRSFVYMSPGVWLADGRWDFIIHHRGPEPVYQVQILFQDQDRLDYIRATRQSISSLGDYEQILTFPEIDPGGRGSIFAKQFLWKPFNPDRSHFTVDITSRTLDYAENIYIARVSGHWRFAMTLRERDTHRKVFACMDTGFLLDKSKDLGGNPCFPRWTSYTK